MNTNTKKAKTIILSITLSFAFVFILLGSLLTAKVFDNSTTLYLNSYQSNYNAKYGETYCYDSYNSYHGYYLLYVDGASLFYAKNESSGDTLSYNTYGYNKSYNSYTYDYCYEVYLSSYTDYEFTIKATSSNTRVLIVRK